MNTCLFSSKAVKKLRVQAQPADFFIIKYIIYNLGRYDGDGFYLESESSLADSS